MSDVEGQCSSQGRRGIRSGALERRCTQVDDFHEQSDLNTRSEAQHHTLGPSQNQAAPGNHNHDGGTSIPLWEGNTLTGSRGGNMALSSVIAILVQKGAVDATTV